MSDFEKLTPEAELRRLALEEWLQNADFDKLANGNRLYKNVREHVLPLLKILGLEVNKNAD